MYGLRQEHSSSTCKVVVSWVCMLAIFILVILVPITCATTESTMTTDVGTTEGMTTPSPTLVCPNDTLTNTTQFSYTEPSASEDSLVVSCQPESGDSFVEGVTVVVCSAKDSVGNFTVANCTFKVTVDTVPPMAKYRNCPNDTVTDDATVVYVEPSASEGVNSLAVSCSPLSGSAFPDNAKTSVVCTAADAAGNTAADRCSFDVTVDTIPPTALFTNCPNDTVTNDVMVVYTEPTASDRADSLTVSCNLPSGSHFPENAMSTVICTAADAVGNVANETCSFNVTVDTTSPTAVFVNCPNDTLANNTTVDYTEPTASDDGESLTVSCDPSSGSVFIANTVTDVTCLAEDAAGNLANETCTFNVTVDTIPPTALFTNCPNDTVTNDVMVVYTEPTASDGADSLTVSCNLPSGSNFPENAMSTVICTAADAVGNVANETCSFYVTVDTTSPMAVFVNCPNDTLTNDTTVDYTEPTASDDGESLTVSCDPSPGSVFIANTVTDVTCLAEDAAGNLANETCTFNVTVDTIAPTALFTNCPNDTVTNDVMVVYTEPTASDGADRLTVSCNLPSGSNFPENAMSTVVCTAADAVGNVANETCSFYVTVDTTSPTAVFVNCPDDTLTNDTTVDYTEPTASDDGESLTVSCDPLSGSVFPENTVTDVTCSAEDAAGNLANETCTFNVTVDTIAPTTLFTNCPNDTVTNDVTVLYTEPTASDGTDTCSPTVSCSLTVSYVEPPVLVPGSCPSSASHYADFGTSSTLVTWTEPTVTDSFDPDPTVTCLPPSGSRFEIGEETVVCTATDAAGNAATPDCTFQVTVTELKAPVIDSITNVSNETMVITWTSQDTVENFTVEYAGTFQDTAEQSVTLPGSEKSYQLTSLLAGETYTLKVIGESEMARAESEEVKRTTELNEPAITAVSSVNMTSMVVEWSAQPNSVVEKYVVNFNGTVRDLERRNVTVGGTVTTVTLDILVPGETYVMRVVASSGSEESQEVSAESEERQETTVPEPVNGLTAEAESLSPFKVKVSWDISSSGVVTSFSASRSEGGDSQNIPFEGGKMSYETSFEGLISGREYTFSVIALSGDKESAVETTSERTAPSPITEFVSSATNKTSITVAWADADGDQDGYDATISSMEATTVPRDPAETSASFEGLTPGEMYTISVKTLSGGLESTAFKDDFVTKPDLPGPVSDLDYRDVTLHSVTVTFTEPAEPNGVVALYRITYSDVWKEEELNTIFKDVPITNLSAGFTYVFKVQAVNEAGAGEARTITAVTKTAPPSPENPVKPITTPIDYQNKSLAPTTTSIVALFLDNYFSHDNGELQNYTIIIAQEGAETSSVAATTKTWSDVKDMETIPPYQAFKARTYPFPPQDPSGRRKRQATPREKLVTLGADDCQSASGYCNGPLRDDTSYVYLFRVWNVAASRDTLFSKPIRTLNDTSMELGLGVGITLSILFIICIILALLVFRRRTQLSRGNRPEMDYWNGGYNPDLIPVQRKGNTRPVYVADFPDHFTSMKADSEYLFSEEYEELRPIGREQATETAVSDVNRSKNRFTNILPYDHTRVKLKQVDDEEGTDYVNANFMPGYNSPREFIACQGPLPGTEDDMWRLVWEQKIETIVMVTQLVEKGRIKCHKYWPSLDKPVYFGEILVTHLSERKLKLWTLREFELEKGEKRRKVRQFNFTDWPDHGVPENCDGILRFVRNVRNQIPPNGPTLVHCSAGVGRTGTFICLDRLIQHLKEHDYVDVFGIVCEMRMHRNFMVQTEDQYIFIHECLMELLQGQKANGSDAVYANVAV